MGSNFLRQILSHSVGQKVGYSGSFVPHSSHVFISVRRLTAEERVWWRIQNSLSHHLINSLLTSQVTRKGMMEECGSTINVGKTFLFISLSSLQLSFHSYNDNTKLYQVKGKKGSSY